MKDITFLTLKSNLADNSISRYKMVVSGREKLAHEAVKTFLTLIGTAIFNPSYGSGFAKIMRYNYSSDDDMKAMMASFIMEAEKSILDNQAGQTIPAEETLKSLELGKVNFDASTGTISADVYVINSLGTVVNTRVTT